MNKPVAARHKHLAGRRIRRVLRTPWDAVPGLDMRGVAGPVWHYARFFLQLDDRKLLELGASELTLHEAEPVPLVDADIGNATIEGATIATVVRHAPPYHAEPCGCPDFPPLVCLADGRYVCDRYGAGGNWVEFGRFDAWGPDERAELVDWWCGRPVGVPPASGRW